MQTKGQQMTRYVKRCATGHATVRKNINQYLAE